MADQRSCPALWNRVQHLSDRLIWRRSGQPEVLVPTVGQHANYMCDCLGHAELYPNKYLRSSHRKATTLSSGPRTGDFGDLGRCWRETDVEITDLETVITDLLDGQYNNPVRGHFNTAERWSRDAEDIAHEIRRRCDLRMTDPPVCLEGFLEQHERGNYRQLTLRLV